MPSYNWVCHVCKLPNHAGVEICGACGFAAVASAVEIDAAIGGQKPETRPSREESTRQLRAQIAALPAWKKPIAYCLRGLMYLGWLIIWSGVFGLAADAMLIGVAVIVVAALLFAWLTLHHDPSSD
jgi:hypothetical protein